MTMMRGNGFPWAPAALAAAALAACGPVVSEQAARLSENLLAMARESFERGDLGDALRKGFHAIEKNPTNADASYFVGFVHAARGDYADAERYLRRTIEIDATYTDARNTLGQILINQRRYREAIAILEEAAGDVMYPAPHLVQANLGQACMESGDLDRAVEWLMRAVREQPKFCVAYYRLGDALRRKGTLDAAEEALALAVAVDDAACRRLQPAWRMLGEVRLEMGRIGPAGEAFAECRDADPATDDGRACAAAAARIGDPPGGP
ncbi:MAG: tetratricopeptide repeat protein [Myxococcota bacterium]|nr:tetratricopeptide repeat protein [Myxococcota bacterium]